MRSASDSVDRISEKLETTAAADLPHVYGRAAEKVCTGCSQCAVCWRKNRDETQKTFSRLSYPLRERGKIERSDFDVPFLTRCNRAMELRDAVNGEYRELLAKESARMRAEQVRAIVEEHFRSTAQMLGDMAEEFEQYQRFDEDSAEQVREVLRHRELTPIEVCCRIDKFGRMTIEANICRTHGVHINKGAADTRDLRRVRAHVHAAERDGGGRYLKAANVPEARLCRAARLCAARSKRRVSLRRLRRGVHGRQRAVYLGFKRRHGHGRPGSCGRHNDRGYGAVASQSRYRI